MKTNGIANTTLVPTNPKGQQPVTKPQLSDRAFYLIALACLLRENKKTAILKQLLEPGPVAA